MRLTSDRPLKNGGWLHTAANPVAGIPVTRKPKKPVTIDAGALWRGWKDKTTPKRVNELGDALGVEGGALWMIGACWIPERQAWGFPMYDAKGKIVGIRIRTLEGDKYAWTGSRNALFRSTMPVDNKQPLWLVEGPTSLSAALTLGLGAIGRPNCSACDEMAVEYVRLNRIRRVVICADVDENEAGLRGAEKLQKVLTVPSVIVFPPVGKDLRDFLKAGGTRDELESMLRNFIWSVPGKVKRKAHHV
jgi:hypothetical protein